MMDLGEALSPDELVDGCLDLIGPLELAYETRNELVTHAQMGGELRHGNQVERTEFSRRTGEMLQMISTTSEFQFG